MNGLECGFCAGDPETMVGEAKTRTIRADPADHRVEPPPDTKSQSIRILHKGMLQSGSQ